MGWMSWLTVVGVTLLVVAALIWAMTRGEEIVTREHDDHYPLELVRPLPTKQDRNTAIRAALRTEEANLKRIEARIRKYRAQLKS